MGTGFFFFMSYLLTVKIKYYIIYVYFFKEDYDNGYY